MGFVDEKKEYVMDDMYPKRTWKNYLWNEEYLTCINQFGIGQSIMKMENGEQREILRNTDNRMIYIKEKDNAYCVNYNYNKLPFTEYYATVGMGYTKIVSEYNDIHSELLIFVAASGRRECWQLDITNKRNASRDIDLYGFAEVNSRISYHSSCNKDSFEKSVNGVCFQHIAYNSPTAYHCIHFASDANIYGYDVDGKKFIGVYGNRANPDGIRQERLSSQDNVMNNYTTGVLQIKLNLQPQETKRIKFTLGVEKSVESTAEATKKIFKDGCFEQELKIITERANAYDKQLYVNTPDDEVNRKVNIWLKRQMDLGKTWGRVFNMGFRDIMQDIMGFVQLDPEFSRKKIVEYLKYQKTDGNTLRAWFPLILEPYRDGGTWLLSAVMTYIKETNDFTILDEKVGYWESDIEETIFEHCLKAAEFLHREVGECGLCLWGGGDWNDSFDGAGLNMIGESVWLSIAAVKATKDFIELLNAMGKKELAQNYINKNNQLTENILKYGWDKDHFIYGINDWRERVGSYDEKEAQLFLNPQTWAVIAGIAPDESALLDLVEDKMKCDYGYVQCIPSYSSPNPHVGRISYFGKGLFENGAVYNHGCAFKMVADCIAGRGDNAYETFKLMSPYNPKNLYTHSGVEPYSMTNMYLGPECELRAGEITSSWTTGTTSWVFRALVEYMIGVRAEFGGLMIDPKLPTEWKQTKITRTYRGAVYEIEMIRNGKTGIYLDDNLLDGKVLPVCKKGTRHKVIVNIK